jgi:hypothetical protein
VCAAALYAAGCGRIGYDELSPVSESPGGNGGSGSSGHAGLDASSGGAKSRDGGAGGSTSSGGAPTGGVSGIGGSGAGTGGAPTTDGAPGTGGGAITDAGDSGRIDSGCSVGCEPWWDPAFTRRRKLTFDQTRQSGDVDGIVVLVRLDPTRIDYAAVQNQGQDLRFVDDDGTTVLPHEVERWVPSGTSIVWVRVPRIDPSTDLDHLWMYYGNGTATDAQQRNVVWAGYDAVYHLDGFSESSGHQPAAVDHGTADVADGIGHARDLDGVATYIDLGPNLPILQSASTITVTLRVRVRTIAGERALLSASVNSSAPTGLSRAFVSFVNVADLRAGGRARDVDATSSFLTTTGAPMSVGTATWQHIGAVMDLTTQEILLFVDGAAQATDGLSLPFSASITDATPTSFNVLGASDDLASQYLDGSLDEVRIAPTRRTPAWIETDARSERDGLIRYGAEQAR